jgi:signal peptidase II
MTGPGGDHRWHWLGVGVPLAVAVDQASKLWAEVHVRGHGIQQVIEGFFDLRFARNRGAFFSMGSRLPELWRLTLFASVAVIASLWMLKLYRESQHEQRRLRAALALLISGAIGNLIDRLRQGEVTDFLHLHFGEVFHWATFNAADIYIAAGLLLLAPEIFASPAKSSQPDAQPDAPHQHP